MERDRQPRRRIGQPAEAAADVGGIATQRAVLELQVDEIERLKGLADLLDVAVGELADATVPAAQQILVEVENRDVENVVELPL